MITRWNTKWVGAIKGIILGALVGAALAAFDSVEGGTFEEAIAVIIAGAVIGGTIGWVSTSLPV